MHNVKNLIKYKKVKELLPVKNIVVAGNIGTGKSTTLNKLDFMINKGG